MNKNQILIETRISYISGDGVEEELYSETSTEWGRTTEGMDRHIEKLGQAERFLRKVEQLEPMAHDNRDL